VKEKGYLHQRSRDYGKVPSILFLDKSISHGAVRLYVYLHWRYGSNMQAFPSQETIAESLGITEKTAGKWAGELEGANWIIVIRRTNKKGHRISNFYRVFEVQKDCLTWREKHNIDRAISRSTRKGRKGIGGKPSHKDAAPNGTPVPIVQKNSSTDRQGEPYQNSSTDKPDSLPKPDSPIEGSEQLFRTIQSDLVQLAFNGNAAQYGSAGDLTHVLLGDATKQQYVQWNVTPCVTADEWQGMKRWWGDKKDRQGHPLKWTRSAQGLNQMAHDFRTTPDGKRYMKQIAEQEQTSDPTVQEKAMAAAIAATESVA